MCGDPVRISLLRVQPQHLTLTRPFDGEVAESGHAHSVGKSPIDGRLDEVRCKEGERDRHIGLAAKFITLGGKVHGWCDTLLGKA